MSTEHQQYSTENQAAKIREYAERRQIQIVRTFADSGKSGLRIDGRHGLQELIRIVSSGSADFQLILVYDVSRWGRFQDADESAYYEYICKRAGIQVTYCAEQFENDGSPVSTIVKGVKRAMAGEYSRELSAKVFAGQCRLVEMGFRQGGAPGYGMRRVLVGEHGVVKGELGRGEHKALQTDRVILVPGPAHEQQIVRQIYRWFVEGSLTESAIAERLNAQGNKNSLGGPWSPGTVHEVLTNEKYVGNNTYNRISFKLKKKRVANPSEMWIRKEGAFDPIVSADLFFMAQGIIRARLRHFSDEELIDRLRALLKARGFLSSIVIDETEGMPPSTLYAARFGGLLRAYQKVGFTPARDYRHLEINRLLRQMHPGIVESTEHEIARVGGRVARPDPDLLQVNEEFTVSLVLARCTTTASGRHRWKIRLDASLLPDITVAVRLDRLNQAPMDYYLLPRVDFSQPSLRLANHNAAEIESYRFDNLTYLYGMAMRTQLRPAA